MHIFPGKVIPSVQNTVEIQLKFKLA